MTNRVIIDEKTNTIWWENFACWVCGDEQFLTCKDGADLYPFLKGRSDEEAVLCPNCHLLIAPKISDMEKKYGVQVIVKNLIFRQCGNWTDENRDSTSIIYCPTNICILPFSHQKEA